MYFFVFFLYFVFLKSFIIEILFMFLGIFMLVMFKNVGVKLMFKIIFFIFGENKISNKVRLFFYNK